MKHTHKAHCQACGRIQALHNDKGTMAKHGYKVAGFGYFAGTCNGSDRQPLEIDRDYADHIVAEMVKEHARLTQFAEDIQSGKKNPRMAKTGNWIRVDGKVTAEEVPFEQANEYHQSSARNAVYHMLLNEARMAKSHGESLAKLIVKVHGQPLIPAKHDDKPVVAAGAVVRIGGKDGYEAKVLRIETRRTWGVGPSLNGQYLPHAVFERNGKEYGYPVRLIRNVIQGA